MPKLEVDLLRQRIVLLEEALAEVVAMYGLTLRARLAFAAGSNEERSNQPDIAAEAARCRE